MIDVPSLAAHVEDVRLETERLVLRRFRPEDLAVEVEHTLDSEIMRFIRDPMSREAAVERSESLLEPWTGAEGEWLGLVVSLRDDDSMIGMFAFRLASIERQTAEIGYRMHPDYHGRGLALEATRGLVEFLFHTAEVHKVVAYCVVDNEPSYRLMEKLGMRREGQLREHSMLGGAWRDELAYGLLASDWNAAR